MKRLAALALLLAPLPAHAVLPQEQLADPAQEARARALSRELRCVVCQNQSIDESDAPLAHDLRAVVRERIRAGDTDAAAKSYLVDRYGHFVLLKPPVEPSTWPLWLGPIAFVALGAGAVALSLRRRRAPPAPSPLSPEDEARAAAILAETPAR